MVLNEMIDEILKENLIFNNSINYPKVKLFILCLIFSLKSELQQLLEYLVEENWELLKNWELLIGQLVAAIWVKIWIT